MTKFYVATVHFDIDFGCPDEKTAKEWISWTLSQMQEEYEIKNVKFEMKEKKSDNIHN